MKQAAIGIFGGTFDPVHFGHLRPALELLEGLELKELRLIPSRQPPHRDAPGASAEQRLAMLQLAAAEQPGFVVDSCELYRDGPSYTVDTLRSARAEAGSRPLLLLLGLDAYLGLGSWHQWQALLELAHIVVAHRPGWSLQDPPTPGTEVARQLLKMAQLTRREQLFERPAGGVWLQPVTQLEISATAIRSLVAHNRSIRYLLPDPVREFIERERLYR